MIRKKATGTRGSWYATVDGERLPCLHQANMLTDGTYRATMVSDAAHQDLLDSILAGGKVIVRKSVRNSEADTWTSKGYLGIFSVADAKIENDVFSLRFVKRLADLNG